MAAFEDWHNTFSNAAAEAKTTYTQANAAKPSREAAMTTAIANAQTANETIRKETDKQTEREYTSDENDSWNTYYAAILAAEKAYLESHQHTEETYRDTKEQQDESYKTTIIPAYTDCRDQLKDLETTFLAAIEHANDPDFNADDYFGDNPSVSQGDYEVIMAKQQGNGPNNADSENQEGEAGEYPYDTPLLIHAYKEFFSKIKPGPSLDIVRIEAANYIKRNRQLYNSASLEEQNRFVARAMVNSCV